MSLKLLFVIISLMISSGVFGETMTLPYSHFGNHKGDLYYPDNATQKMGVVIYNYDEYYARYGDHIALDRGYDIPEIARIVNSKGYMLFVPENRDMSITTVQGAILAMLKHPLVDRDRIHISGVSEGATLAIMSLTKEHYVASVTIMSASPMRQKGQGSLAHLVRQIDRVGAPVMIGVATEGKPWRIDFSRELRDLLVRRGKQVMYLEYPVPRYWFWLPRTEFMQRYLEFIRDVDGVEPAPQKVSDDSPEELS